MGRSTSFSCPILSFSSNPHELLALARRVLAVSGAVIVAIPNIDAPQCATATGPTRFGYYELYDAISKHFPRVRMVGQVPFVGYAMAEFAAGADDLEPTIDSSLVAREREPGWFIALASARPVLLESFVLVETPPADESQPDVRDGTAARGEAASTMGARSEPSADERDAVVGMLTRERDDARASVQQERRAREQERAAATRSEHRAATLERDLAGLRERLNGVGAELEAEIKRRSVAEAELERSHRSPDVVAPRPRVGEFDGRPAPAAAERDEELTALRDRCEYLEAQLGVASNRRERELAPLRDRVASLETELASLHTEHQRSLAASRERIASLETELASRTGEYERGLVASRERSASLQAELTSLQADHQRSLIALRERIGALEARITSLNAELAEARERSQALEAKLATVDGEYEQRLAALRDRSAALETQLSVMAADQENDVARLEKLLKERGRLIADLRVEVARRDHLVREMAVMGVPATDASAKDNLTEQAIADASPEHAEGGQAPGSVGTGGWGQAAQRFSVSFAGFGAPADEARSDEALEVEPEEDADGIAQATAGTADLSESSPAELRDRLDTLARRASRREADLVAANWKIAQLERQLAQVQR